MKNKLIDACIRTASLSRVPYSRKEQAAALPLPMRTGAAAYIAMGIASGLCGIGQGRATASAAEAMARNPGRLQPSA